MEGLFSKVNIKVKHASSILTNTPGGLVSCSWVTMCFIRLSLDLVILTPGNLTLTRRRDYHAHKGFWNCILGIYQSIYRYKSLPSNGKAMFLEFFQTNGPD